LPVGRLNNVDLRYGLRWQGKPHDVAVASLRNNNSLQLFAIAADGSVKTPPGKFQRQCRRFMACVCFSQRQRKFTCL
jgi:3-phytase